MVWVGLPKLVSSYDVMLMVHKIVDELNELGFLVATVGEVNKPTIETVVKDPLVISVVYTCSSCDGSAREIHQLGVDRDLEGGVYGVLQWRGVVVRVVGVV
jgi:hypothetical protein